MASPRWSRRTFAASGFGVDALTTVGLALGLYFGVPGCNGPAPPPTADARPVLPRPEFSGRLMGKTEAEVIEAVGRPDDTTEDPDAKYWHFKRRTRDPVSGAVDTDVQVVLKNGKVDGINY